MKLSTYTYDLPEALIADNPPEVRGTSRLLVLQRQSGNLEDSRYASIADYLEPGDLLVLNNTKVIKARLIAKKENGAERELIVLEKHGHQDDWHQHHVLYRRRLAAGDTLYIGDTTIQVVRLLGDGIAEVRSQRDLLDLTEAYGKVPLPPYMHREATAQDVERYQTVWAKEQGSVAAPTASLNMTEEILHSLRVKGVSIAYLTLHVGLGTFLPIRSDEVEEHEMHQEYFEIPAETVEAIQQTKAAGRRVVALGTTVTRTLEYAHDALKEPARNLSGEADIFIYPGYTFQTIDGLLTNFHAPKSTVLMLTAAFAGWEHLQRAYHHAVQEQYRFLSYGDSMLIL
ncbi:MAG TPA: tRNA preQ1(34) S-adenosylmethionine ribosyltransferase-isomerase QueA [Candidatus Saccharimonadales bacterium]|nr:tRNA preQ1(34) S-adenosylmethionine ribosyltransferase-isomerase QueA [Candidatus Saccharimonadales bacterium]